MSDAEQTFIGMMFTSQRAIMHVKQLLWLSRGSAIDNHQEENSGGQLALYFFWVLMSIWKLRGRVCVFPVILNIKMENILLC